VGIGADAAYLGIGYAIAHAAMLYLVFKGCKGLRKSLHIAIGLTKKM
jgi:hypothetical protein